MIRMLAMTFALTLVGAIGAAQARSRADALPAGPDLRLQSVAPRIPTAEFRGMAPFVDELGRLDEPRFDPSRPGVPAFREPPHTRDAGSPYRATD